MPGTVSNLEDLLDSGDIEERITELENTIEEHDFQNAKDGENAAEELAALLRLREQVIAYADDWDMGLVLIRDAYFKRYAMELAEDIGAIPEGLAWPMTCIDWDQAARQLQMDYTSVQFAGQDYWYR